MNTFERLANESTEEKERLGIVHTPKEILQQPNSWARTIQLINDRRESLDEFIESTGLRSDDRVTIITTGAGSSEFVGTSVQSILQSRFQQLALSIPTTHLVTHANKYFLADQSYVLISFARSGNSPESIATYDLANIHARKLKHIVISCNPRGALAKKAESDSSAFCFLLPEETNDRSLVMTSSFSSMSLAAAGIAYLDDIENFEAIGDGIIKAGERICNSYGDLIEDFSGIPFKRACYLGSDALFGTMQECQLKMLEMSDGQIATRFDSFLGLRHGPQVFVNEECAVIASLSSDETVQKYEMDLLEELKAKKQGCGTLLICNRRNPAIDNVSDYVIELSQDEPGVPDQFRIMTDVVVGQMLATLKCLNLGLKPDTPSASGVIHRVVQGVTIYGS